MADGSLDLFPAPVISAGLWRVEQGDAVDWLKGLPTESVHCIVTDPAYESLEIREWWIE